MAALSAAFETYEKPGLVVSYKLAAVKIYKGALVGINSSGYLTKMDPATASLKYIGVANETVDNSAGNAGDKSLNVTKSGSFVVKAASGFSPSISDLGKEVYASSDWEVQVLSAGFTNTYKVGTIVCLESTSTGAAGVRIRVDNHTV